MTSYPRSAYGSTNVNAGYPANGDRAAWGGYSWPGGVPTGLLGRTDYTSTFGQRLTVLMRRELVPLWNLAFELIDKKHRYQVYARKDGEAWGPWGYANRAVSGTSTASGHSMGLSVDMNAPNNPYSTSFQSDMPPAMVADLESLGLYWGGRYTGKADAMHYGFCRAPGTVPQYIDKARSLLGSPTPVPPSDGGFLMALTDKQQTDLYNWVKSLHSQFVPSGTAPGQTSAGSTLAATLKQAQANGNKLNEINTKV
jgi:hypothetical protein